jgi:hypothetical protein
LITIAQIWLVNVRAVHLRYSATSISTQASLSQLHFFTKANRQYSSACATLHPWSPMLPYSRRGFLHTFFGFIFPAMLSRHPFARIPAEIWDHIFGLVASRNRGRLRLLAINQDFRSYALSSPRLWTRISICKSDTLRAYASSCIALSCKFSLDITLNGSGDLISSQPDLHLVPFFRTAPRWRSATLHLSKDFPLQSCEDFSYLEELTLHFVDYGVLPPFVIQNEVPRHSHGISTG